MLNPSFPKIEFFTIQLNSNSTYPKVEFLVLLVFVVLVLFYCLVSLLTASICLLKRTKCLSGHKLIQFFDLYFRTCPAMSSVKICLHIS